jgi:hypothetical protein
VKEVDEVEEVKERMEGGDCDGWVVRRREFKSGRVTE